MPVRQTLLRRVPVITMKKAKHQSKSISKHHVEDNLMGYILDPHIFDFEGPVREIGLWNFATNDPLVAAEKKGVVDSTWSSFTKNLNQMLGKLAEELEKEFATKQSPKSAFRRITSGERNSLCTIFAHKFPLLREKYYEFHKLAEQGIDLGGSKLYHSTFKTTFEVCT